MPGAEALMAWANDKGLIQAIVTGGQRISVERTLHYYGLATYIDLITSQEDVTHNKPAPDSYRLTLERLGLNPQAAIAIEDNARGLQAACEAGIACIVVHNSFSKGQDFTGAIACVDNLTQALAWIKQTYYR